MQKFKVGDVVLHKEFKYIYIIDRLEKEIPHLQHISGNKRRSGALDYWVLEKYYIKVKRRAAQVLFGDV